MTLGKLDRLVSNRHVQGGAAEDPPYKHGGHADGMVFVVDFVEDPGLYDTLNPLERRTPSRLIHARNAPWALPCVQSHSGRSYGKFTEWVSSSAEASNPRERVWRADREEDYARLRFGYEYFATHPTVKHPCDASRAVGGLVFDHYESGHRAEWRVCLQRLGVLCYSMSDSFRGNGPGAVALVIEDTKGCPTEWSFPLDTDWQQEGKIGMEKFTHRFFEHVVCWAIRRCVEQWLKVIRGSQAQFMRYEKNIFADPENELWGDMLWRCTQNWNIYSRLIAMHLKMLGYLQSKAEQFLRYHYALWEEVSRETGQAIEPHHIIYPPGSKLFGSLDLSFAANQAELTQGLINPMAHLLDMIYKRIAIRDARHLLLLNESLWRLSWITFIFLPLTFITGVFGMNVDTFADNPSIKWWFIVAVPPMVVVLLAWFFFRSSYSAASRQSFKRSKTKRETVWIDTRRYSRAEPDDDEFSP